MSNDERDRIVGAAHRRLKAAKSHMACLESKLSEIARAHRRIADLTETPERLARAPDGHLSVLGMSHGPEVVHPNEEALLDTVERHQEARKELDAATREWESLDT